MNEEAIDERLFELAFSDWSVAVLQGCEAEGPVNETGEEVYVGDAAEGEGGDNEETLIGERGNACG